AALQRDQALAPATHDGNRPAGPSGIRQSIGSRPAATRASLARENGRLPKNPLDADSGDGWGDSITVCRLVSISAFFLRADAPHRMNTTRSGLAFTAF